MKPAALALSALTLASSCAGKRAAPGESAGTAALLPGPISLVQSTPVETDLAQPGLPDTRETWLNLIRSAQRTLDLAQFYVALRTGAQEPGETALEAVIRELERAGGRGVRIRLLISNELLDEDPAAFERLKKIPGLEARVYDIEKLTGGILHAKYWIVDGQTVFLGSQNLDWRALTHIHETGALITDGTLATQLGRVFEIDWEIARTGQMPDLSGTEFVPPSAGTGLELVASPAQLNPRGLRPALDALLQLIQGARRSVRIQLLDYSLKRASSRRGESPPEWHVIDRELRAAGERGVKVELLVSHWNAREPGLSHIKSLTQARNVRVRIATIPRYSQYFIPYARVIHSKYMVVDGKALWLGTSNWSEDYFVQSRNVELILRKPGLATQADAIFEKLWSGPFAAPVDPSKSYPAPDISGKKEG